MRILKAINEKKVEDYTPTNPHFNGDTFRLGDQGDWWSIIKTHQDGKSIKNQHGGFPVLHVGSRSYVMKRWKQIKDKYEKRSKHSDTGYAVRKLGK